MSTGAIAMMIIGCVGLWGGYTLTISIAVKNSVKNKRRTH